MFAGYVERQPICGLTSASGRRRCTASEAWELRCGTAAALGDQSGLSRTVPRTGHTTATTWKRANASGALGRALIGWGVGPETQVKIPTEYGIPAYSCQVLR
jgi:hypothetical protein